MKTIGAALILFLALLPAALPRAAAPAQGQTQNGAAEYEQRLAKVRRDIDVLRAKLKDEEKKEQTTLSKLDRLSVTKSLLRGELHMLNLQSSRNHVELEAARQSIPRLEARLAKERQALTRVLVTLYKFGRFSFVRFLLQAHDLHTLAVESKRLAVLASTQDKMIEDYGRNLAELGRAAETLAAREKDTASLIARTASKKTELEREEAKAKSFVAQVRTDRKTYEQALSELGRRAQELQTIIQRLEKQEFAPPFALTSFTEKKGRLPWPTAGKVIQGFGIRTHPQFNTVTMNNGLEIAPPQEDPIVRAVHDGRIAFAEYFPAYGNLLIINHGQGYHSLYGHLAEFLVKTGDYVLSGQPVAVAGDTASLLGTSVYFEIRQQTKPVDPLQWLSRR
jgi:septal ring factor EnvC (AmiA/AmiB activator)